MGIMEDQDMIELTKELEEDGEEKLNAQLDDLEMTDKFEANIDEAIEHHLPECDVIGQKIDGTDDYETLPFNYYLAAFLAFHYVNMYEQRHAAIAEREERRELMKAGDDEGYDNCMDRQMHTMQLRGSKTNKVFFEKLGLPYA